MAGNIIRFDISGDKQLMHRMKGIIPRLRKKVLTQSAREAMKPLLKAAKTNAPKDSGMLRRSLRMRAMKRNRRGLVGVHISTSDKWFSGSQFYGAFQEFGWKTGRRRAFTEWKISPQMFASLSKVSKTIAKLKPNADGTAWVPAWSTSKPRDMEARQNAKSVKQTQNRKDVPGKHFVEDTYLFGREMASSKFISEVRRRLDEIAKGGM